MSVFINKDETCNGCNKLRFYDRVCKLGCGHKSGKAILDKVPLTTTITADNGYIHILRPENCLGKKVGA